jgi:hypothetical protein
LAISNSETSPEDMSFHLALQVGHDVVTCIGVRVGERILSPSEMSHFVKNATPNHLSISCNAGADLGDLLATIDAQALSQSGTIRLSVNSPSTLPDWKVQLCDSELSPKSGVPVRSGSVFLGDVNPEHFVLLLQCGGRTVSTFSLSIEPITIPDGIDTGLHYLRIGRLRDAQAIFRCVLSLRPASQELSDLMGLSTALFAAEMTTRHNSGETIDVVRDAFATESPGPEDLAQIVKRLDATSLTEAMKAIDGAFGPSLTAREAHPQLPWAVREALEHLTYSIHQRLNAPLEELKREVGNVGNKVKSIADQMLPRYEDNFSMRLGKECWSWLGKDTQTRLVEGESEYRKSQFAWNGPEPDFYLAVLAMCSGLELLLRGRLESIRTNVQKALRRPNVVMSLRENPRLLDNHTIDIDRAVEDRMSLGQFAFILLASRVIVARFKDLLPREEVVILSNLNHLHLINPLLWLASQLRNPASHSATVPIMDVLLTRKLLFGIDEYGIQEGRAVSSMKHLELGSTRRQREWKQYPGIFPLIWKAFDSHRS